jgi:hypothetical protein
MEQPADFDVILNKLIKIRRYLFLLSFCPDYNIYRFLYRVALVCNRILRAIVVDAIVAFMSGGDLLHVQWAVTPME